MLTQDPNKPSAHIEAVNKGAATYQANTGILRTFAPKNFPHTDFFLCFSMMKRVRKGSDLPKQKWGSPSIQQKYSHTKLRKGHPLYVLLSVRIGARA